MKHLKITFPDGTEEHLDAKYDKFQVLDGELRTYSSRTYGPDEPGPAYSLMNIRKREWVEGY